jgi:hypothetical protein
VYQHPRTEASIVLAIKLGLSREIILEYELVWNLAIVPTPLETIEYCPGQHLWGWNVHWYSSIGALKLG